MKKRSKVLLLIGLFIVVLAILGILISKKMIGYVIVVGTIAAVLFTELIGSVVESNSDEAKYLSNLKKILKTYDAILAKSSVLPDLDDRNIIIVESIQDLVNAQVEIRKPIFYKMQVSCCSFFLLDEKDACVYTIKMNEDVVSDLDILIKEKKFKQKKKIDDEYSLLKNIDKTSIIVLENAQSYKVSPIRKKKEEKNDVKVEEKKEKDVEETKKEDKKEKVVEETKKEDKKEKTVEETKKEDKKEKAVEETKKEEKKEEKEHFDKPVMIHKNIDELEDTTEIL